MGEIMLVVAILIFVGTLCFVVIQTIHNMSDDTDSSKNKVCHDSKHNERK